MRFSEIKPYVRYARVITGSEYGRYSYAIRGYDHRLLLCTGGRGSMEIDGRIYPVEQGTVLLWQAGVPYTYLPDSLSPMQCIALNFDFTFEESHRSVPIPPIRADSAEEEIEALRQRQIFFEDVPLFQAPLMIPGVKRGLSEKLWEIVRVFEEQKNHFEMHASGLFGAVLAELALLSEGGGGKDAGSRTVDVMIAYFKENYAKKLSMKELGEQFGYHPNYLNQLFLRHTGKSMYGYLQDLRILQAIHLLQTTDVSIGRISERCGFGDVAHFSRYFKQKTGRSPREFRL